MNVVFVRISLIIYLSSCETTELFIFDSFIWFFFTLKGFLFFEAVLQ